jgi:hypothetical protein
MTSSGLPSFCRASSVSTSMKSVDALDAARVRGASRPGRCARLLGFDLLARRPGLELLAVIDEALGGVGAAVEQHVLDEDEQLRRISSYTSSMPALTMPMSMPAP